MRGDGSLYKRGPVWWMKFAKEGRTISMSTGTSNKSEAKEKLRAEIAKSKGAEWLDPQQRKTTIAELIKDFKQSLQVEGDQSASRLADVTARWENHLKAHFENLRADRLTTELQRKYRLARQAEGDGNSTINRELAILRRAYKLASEAEPPTVSRVPKFDLTDERGNARKVFIDTATEEKLKEAARKRASEIHELWPRVMMEMAFAYGWRRGEIIERLYVRSVDLADKTIRLETTKNGEPREVPILSQHLFVLLQAMVTGRDADERLFMYTHKTKENPTGVQKPVTVRTAQNEWERICEAAGVKAGRKDGGIIMHDIRRSSARNKRAAGVDTSLIMHLQGWKTDAMFRRYAIVDRSDLAAALQQESAFKQQLAESRKAEAELSRTATEQLQSARLPQA